MDINDIEINFVDMFLYVCSRWRVILSLSLITCIVFVGYKFITNTGVNEDNISYIDLTTEEQNQVDLYYLCKDMYDLQVEQNQSNSIITDYSKGIYYSMVEFLVTGDNNSELVSKVIEEKIIASCDSMNDYDQFTSVDSIKYNNLLLDFNDESIYKDDRTMLKIVVYGDTQESCNELLLSKEKCIENYKKEVERICGQFDISILFRDSNKYKGTLFDNYIISCRDSQVSRKTTVYNIYNSLSDNAKKYVNNNVIEEYKESVTVKQKITDVKTILVGVLIGFCLSFFCFLVEYYFNTKLRFEDDVETIFGMHVLGYIASKQQKKGIDKFLLSLRRPRYKRLLIDDAIDIVIANIVALNKDMNKILLLGCCFDDREREIIEKVVSKIKEYNINIEVGEPILYSSSTVKLFENNTSVILVEKAKCSKYKDIKKEIKKCSYYNQNIIGIIVTE